MSIIYGSVVLLGIFELYLTDAVYNYVTLKNVDCASYINYVHTDKYLRYVPWVVKLHKCAGRDGAKLNYGCVPKTIEKVTVLAFLGDGKSKDIVLENVTSCYEDCLLNDTSCNEYQELNKDDCKCTCNQMSPPDTCVPPFHWDQNACDCLCPIDPDSYPCEKKMAFDKELCRCACKKNKKQKCRTRGKIINEETCECESPDTGRSGKDDCPKGGVSPAFVAVIVIGEFLCMICLFILFKKYCEHPNLLFQRNCYAKTGDLEECKKDEHALVENT